MLSTAKSFEILPKQNEYGFVSESYALNWYIFTPLAYKKCYFHCNAGLYKLSFVI